MRKSENTRENKNTRDGPLQSTPCYSLPRSLGERGKTIQLKRAQILELRHTFWFLLYCESLFFIIHPHRATRPLTNNMASNCTETNVTFPMYLKEPFAVTIFRIGFQISIGFFGIIGNAIVCMMIMRKPKVLGPTSQYLFSLAIADIGILIFNFPIGILKQQDPLRWYLGRAFCLYVAPATETFFGAAIFTITLIAFERYLNIVRTVLRTRRALSHNQRRLVLTIVWTASFAVTSVPLYMFQAYDPCHRMCYHTWSVKVFLIYIITLTALQYVVPLAIIGFSYMHKMPTRKFLWVKTISHNIIIRILLLLFGLCNWPCWVFHSRLICYVEHILMILTFTKIWYVVVCLFFFFFFFFIPV